MKEYGNVIKLYYDKINNSLYRTKPRRFIQRDYMRLELERLTREIRKRYPASKPLSAEQWYKAHTTDEQIIKYRQLLKEYWQKGEDIDAVHTESIFVCEYCRNLYEDRRKNIPCLRRDDLYAVFIRGESFINRIQDVHTAVEIYCSSHYEDGLRYIDELLDGEKDNVEIWVERHTQASLEDRLLDMGFSVLNLGTSGFRF